MNQERLFELARLCGLETTFHDGLGRFNQASPEAVDAVLKSLGFELNSDGDLDEALWLKREEVTSRFLEPVIVSWDPRRVEFSIRVPIGKLNESISVRLACEGEVEREILSMRASDLCCRAVHTFNGTQHAELQIVLPSAVPIGYHQLSVSFQGREERSSLFSSPPAAYSDDETSRTWGVWIPLYAVRTQRSWGAGDFTDLATVSEWVASLGGRFVGILPIFAAFLERLVEPSPYAPVSRLFWNEFYVDPVAAPEWSGCQSARDLFNSKAFQDQLHSLRTASQVDYQTEMQLRRQILERLSEAFFASPGAIQTSEYEGFLKRNPQVEEYARFRAIIEKQGRWQHWSPRLLQGRFKESDYDPEVERYHLYAQWLAGQQVKNVLESAAGQGIGLYLDLPLGVHPEGYDAWKERGTFAQHVSGGAPPDDFFSAGQDWGFHPIHPERSRLQAHRYFRQTVSHLMSHSDLVRVDHAMSLHRLYWVPDGLSAREGLYVRYPEQELLAILVIESHRHRCIPVGEDLGTVPPIVREMMGQRRLLRMYVGQFENSSDRVPPLNVVAADVVASLNTHDTATFAAFWKGLDNIQRFDLGLLGGEDLDTAQKERERLRRALADCLGVKGDLQSPPCMTQVMRQWLKFLARSKARHLLVHLEDLWLELRPHNVPGTTAERDNWRRKMRYSFEEFCNDRRVIDTLQEIDQLRRVKQ